MITSVELYGKPVVVQLSRAAMNAAKRSGAPLMAEIHLIFGCMVAKRVWFTEKLPGAAFVVNGVSICFRPVRDKKSCRLDGADKGALSPPDRRPQGPFRAGHHLHRLSGRQLWTGDFTYDREAASRLLARHRTEFPASSRLVSPLPTTDA